MNGPTASSSRALIAIHNHSPSSSRSILSSRAATEESEEHWHPILQTSNQVVLYNPRSHALSITPSPSTEALTSGVIVARRQRRDESIGAARVTPDLCPYCKQSLPPGFVGYGGSHSNTGGNSLSEEEEEVRGRWGYLDTSDDEDSSADLESVNTDPAYHARASDYFRLLETVNETSSTTSSARRASISSHAYSPNHDGREEGSWSSPRARSSSRRSKAARPEDSSHEGAFPAEKMAEGYFKTFFQEEYKLGMGANGTVFLCQHVLDGHPLGHFAVKKIAVGESHSYLLKILREVRLLERLHHPNIITYHHAWLETAQFSSFGPKVPTLHVLMQWAEGGSLDDFIDVRLGRKPAHIHMHPLLSTTSAFNPSAPSSPSSPFAELSPDGNGNKRPHSQHASSRPEDPQSRAARIKAFRAYQRAPPKEKERIRREMDESQGSGPSRVGEWKPVHLFSAEEVKSLFNDVVSGLAFLHDRSILHLDLKPGNVLLTWDDGQLIPRAMLSDFGTSRDMINSTRTLRSGNTGTLEYTAPETLPSPSGLLQQINSKADMWSLGMLLHKMLFFKLPYRYAAVGDANGQPISKFEESEKLERLEKEVAEYPGFKSNTDLVAGFEGRRLPRSFLVLLETLLHKSPASRPSVERVKVAIKSGKFDPLTPSQSLPLARPWTDSSVSAASQVTGQNSGETPVVGNIPLLALPSPTEVLGPAEGSWRQFFSWTAWVRFWMVVVFRRNKPGKRKKRSVTELREYVHNGLSLRLLQSSLLVIKVFTVSRMYSSPLTRTRSLLAALLLAAALAETVINHDGEHPEISGQTGRRRRGVPPRMKGLWVTLSMALFHFAVLACSAWAEGSLGSPMTLGRRID